MIPSLNPEEKTGGSFSIKHIMKYTIAYNLRMLDDREWDNPDIVHDTGVQMGRIRVIAESIKWIEKQDLFTVMFGIGGGALSKSYLTKNKYDIMFTRLRIRGVMPFMISILLECGVVGLISFSIFLLRFYLAIRDRFFSVNDRNDRIFVLGMLGVQFIFIFDSFIYSCASMTYNVLTPIYYFLLACIFIKQSFGIEKFLPRINWGVVRTSI